MTTKERRIKTTPIEFVPGRDDEEVAFVSALMSRPGDVTTRRVFADWLDEHDRPKEAKYLREIRAEKFARLVRQRGLWAFRPEHLVQMPRHPMKYPVVKPGRFWDVHTPGESVTTYPDLRKAMERIERQIALQHEPPPGHPSVVPLSDRCKAWLEKFRRGWRRPKHIKRNGWSMRVRYYGVYDWELLHIIDKEMG